MFWTFFSPCHSSWKPSFPSFVSSFPSFLPFLLFLFFPFPSCTKPDATRKKDKKEKKKKKKTRFHENGRMKKMTGSHKNRKSDKNHEKPKWSKKHENDRKNCKNMTQLCKINDLMVIRESSMNLLIMGSNRHNSFLNVSKGGPIFPARFPYRWHG